MVLTYTELQRIYRSEKKTSSLCNVGEDFYSGLKELISQVRGEHRDSIERMAEDIYLRRRNKVLMQVMRSMDTEPLNSLPREKKLYWALVDVLKGYGAPGFMGDEESSGVGDSGEGREDVEESEDEGEKPVVEGGKVRLRLIKAVPSIVGSDARNYGPFNAMEEVELPEKTASILLDWKVAEEV